jgi:hypothetical protein
MVIKGFGHVVGAQMSLMGLTQSLFLVGIQQRQLAMSVVFQELDPDYSKNYKDLYLRQVLNKEKWSGANDQLDATIIDLQDSAVLAIITLVNPPWPW